MLEEEFEKIKTEEIYKKSTSSLERRPIRRINSKLRKMFFSCEML